MFGQDPFANIRQLVAAPVEQMRTFALLQPVDTHFRVATCQEVDCANWRNGWAMGFDLTDPERVKAARWVRNRSGRAFTSELINGVDGRPAKVVLTFAAGQRCFQVHRVPLERDPFMVVRRGDFRGNPDGPGAHRVHTSADSFLDHWSSDLDALNTRRERA